MTWKRTTSTTPVVYSVEIIDDTTATRDLSGAGLPRLPLPLTLQAIECEVLKCLVHLILPFKVPAMMIIGTRIDTTTKNQDINCTFDVEHEVCCFIYFLEF